MKKSMKDWDGNSPQGRVGLDTYVQTPTWAFVKIHGVECTLMCELLKLFIKMYVNVQYHLRRWGSRQLSLDSLWGPRPKERL